MVRSLTFLKWLHTVIWLIMAGAVFYVFYSGVSGNITSLSWIAVCLVITEGFALLLGKGECPLYAYTLRVTGKTALNDTYLPEWIFFPRYKSVFTVIFLIGLLLMASHILEIFKLVDLYGDFERISELYPPSNLGIIPIGILGINNGS